MIEATSNFLQWCQWCKTFGPDETFSTISFFFFFFFFHFFSWLVFIVVGGGRVVRWCWVNFQCRDVLQFGLE